MPCPSCERCSRPAETVLVLLRQNISYLWGRQERLFCGYLCARCLLPMWGGYTLPTLLLTWFGIVGVVLGPLFILMNTLDCGRGGVRLAGRALRGKLRL